MYCRENPDLFLLGIENNSYKKKIQIYFLFRRNKSSFKKKIHINFLFRRNTVILRRKLISIFYLGEKHEI